jgi:hypothetical protein
MPQTLLRANATMYQPNEGRYMEAVGVLKLVAADQAAWISFNSSIGSIAACATAEIDA